MSASDRSSADEIKDPSDLGGRSPRGVVGVGASAGGLESLERMFSQMPEKTGLAFVVIQHLSPDFRSMTDELLARRTSIPIELAREGVRVEADRIYLLPPRKEMIIAEGRLHLTDKDPEQALTLPIDHFFRSLAHDCQERAVGVILSGTGSDGSRGVREIHNAGGIVICEDERTAKFDGMPVAAQQTGCVDEVAPAMQIPEVILRRLSDPALPSVRRSLEEAPPLVGIEAVFELLRDQYDIDFSHYKPSTVSRRIERRLDLLQVNDIDDYVARLRDDADELNSLYCDLLIGVTKFFRDGEPFQLLSSSIIPSVLERVPPQEEVRVWVAGCATGEEAYSIAILFHEAMEQAKRPAKLKVFATDVHRASLQRAGIGVYDPEQVSEVSPTLLQKYFREKSAGYQIVPEVRQSVVFAQHNAIKDAPFTNLDLISCRNLLIYFRREAQKKALSLFHFGLKTGGVLLLGSSEAPGELADEFETIDQRCRCYRKRRDIRLPAEIRLPLSRNIDGLRGPAPTPIRREPISPAAAPLGAYDALLDRFMPPSFLVSADRELIDCFGGAEKLLHLRRRPSRDLLDLLEAEEKTSIAGALNRVIQRGKPISFSGVRLRGEEETASYRLEISELVDKRSQEMLYLVVLQREEQPAVARARTDDEVEADEMTRDQVRHLEDELRHSRENLQATIEELETSNEEMQATNQELVAANEELQSTNEELHSVNEELYTVNAEHQKKIEELAELNQDIEHLLRSSDVAIIFLDRDLCIRKFTPQVAEVFDLVDQDVGRRIGTFAHRIRHDRLVADLQAVLDDGERRQTEVRDLDGRCYFMRILPYLVGSEIEGVVLSLIDISALDQTRSRVSQLSAIVESSEDAIIGVDLQGNITSWNQGAEQLYGHSAQEAIGRHISLLAPRGVEDGSQALFDRLGKGESIDAVEINQLTKDGHNVHVALALSPIRDGEGNVVGASSISRDISAHKEAEAARAYLSAIVESSEDAIVGKTLDGIITSWNSGAERLYGYSAEEMLGEPITKLAPEDRLEEIAGILDRLRRGLRIAPFETVRRKKDGTLLDVSLTVSPIRDASGGMIGASAITRDITQLKQARRELQQRARRTRSIVDSALDAIVTIDEQSIVTRWNPQAEQVFGYTSDEAVGVFLPEMIMPAELREVHYRGMQAFLRTGESPLFGRRVEFEAIRKSGEPFPVELTVAANRFDEAYEFTAFVRDVSDRRRAENQIRMAVRRRDEFLAMLSHELRNPLSAVRTAARVLTNATSDDELRDKTADVLERQTAQMSRLLDDLLDVSRITQDKITLKKRVIDLRQTVEESVESIQSFARERGVSIDVETPSDSLPIEADVTRLGQIQANLLANAVRHSETGGRILLKLERRGDEAVLVVRDHGVGIEPDMLEEIFDMFVQGPANGATNREGGMGVGLTLVKRLVELHGGKVIARSEGLGLGSEFEVRLPIAAAAPKTTKAPPPHLPPRRGVRRIVVIEDKDDNRAILRSLLELEGFDVDEAADGASGAELVVESRPDAVVIDIGLPGMGGLEVARRIRAAVGPDVLLIALTGFGQPHDVAAAMEAGFDHHLVKPLQPELLLSLLRSSSERSGADSRR